jgi:hypothetical protein
VYTGPNRRPRPIDGPTQVCGMEQWVVGLGVAQGGHPGQQLLVIWSGHPESTVGCRVVQLQAKWRLAYICCCCCYCC